MFKRPSVWPAGRRLFRDKATRSVAAVWLVLALSIAAATLLATCVRHPAV